ncbi:prepilin-type N-terminal cleavage/methylation domain-containing protein [Candidatus Poribacteria bacterium]|nr:prepilin-type N-terminal cleavage/methylation domain-containing protein [Candidatus Poribacteria bacterium]
MHRAFTLIELLVVVAVIAILAAIALPNFLEAQTRSRVSRVKADFATVAIAMESYAVDHNGWPPDWDSQMYGTVPFGEGKTYAILTTPIAYITTPPRDPFNGILYEYYQEDAIIRFGDPWVPSWQRRGIHWFAYSFGPDRINDLLAQDQELAIQRMYDPTNGTVSGGDVGRTNVGLVPGN